jgi:dTDP-4-amino-4,6-dideoxygalactose transaminase
VASYLGVKHVIGMNSGTDALYLSVKAAGIQKGDEVITVAQTFVATIAAIIHIGGKPVLVDIREDFNMDVDRVEDAVTEKTKAIIPVHLNGRVCDMDKLELIADRYGLLIIEDAAQALGASYKGRRAGSFGIANCFSLHPMKTLNCAGDGGFVSTNDDDMATNLRLLRDHGQKTKKDLLCFGYNSRLDNLQAAILNVKFRFLDEWIARRREIANLYSDKLADFPLILPPKPSNGDHFDTFNSYVIRTERQQELSSFLTEREIEVFLSIPKPLYQHTALGIPDYHFPLNERICRETVSLPIYPEMTDGQVEYVVSVITEFFGGR